MSPLLTEVANSPFYTTTTILPIGRYTISAFENVVPALPFEKYPVVGSLHSDEVEENVQPKKRQNGHCN